MECSQELEVARGLGKPACSRGDISGNRILMMYNVVQVYVPGARVHFQTEQAFHLVQQSATPNMTQAQVLSEQLQRSEVWL